MGNIILRSLCKTVLKGFLSQCYRNITKICLPQHIFFLFFYFFLKSVFDLLWPLITSNDIDIQNYIPYLSSNNIFCIWVLWPKNIRKSLLLGDLEKNKKIKMAAAAILKMAASWTMLTLSRGSWRLNLSFNPSRGQKQWETKVGSPRSRNLWIDPTIMYQANCSPVTPKNNWDQCYVQFSFKEGERKCMQERALLDPEMKFLFYVKYTR